MSKEITAEEYYNLTIDERILYNAVQNYNGTNYGSLTDAIRRQHYLDDEAIAKFDELLPKYLEMIEDEEL